MATSNLVSLATETILHIEDYLDDDKSSFSLCCASTRLRAILAPRVFRTINFTPDKASADTALARVQAHGYHTKELIYDGSRFTNVYQYGLIERSKFPEKVLPKSAEVLLMAGHELVPNLDSVSVDFGTPDEWCSYSTELIWETPLFVDDERLTACVAARLTKDVLTALAASRDIRQLKMLNWPPLRAAVFDTDEWKNVLRKLQGFEISVLNILHSSVTLLWDLRGFTGIISEMGDFFYKHLEQVHKVSITFPRDTPIGAHNGEWEPTPIPSLRGTMPMLEELEMENFIIARELVDYLTNSPRPSKLRKLALRGVTADYECQMDGEISWQTFFDTLVRGRVRLEEFELQCRAPLTFTEHQYDWQDYKDFPRLSDDTEPDVAHIREKIEHNPERTVFGYSIVHGENGFWEMEYDGNVESWEAGVDQAAFDAFMATVGPIGE